MTRISATPIPKFVDLPRPDDSGLPRSWQVWGPDDQLGTMNHIAPETAAAACRLVRRGVRFNLDLPLHLPYSLISEGFLMQRRAPVHGLDKLDFRTLHVRDDKLDGFYLQGSTQWDGLTHVGSPQYGFYNGVRADQITFGPDTRNGIEHLAEFGIVTRGVLVDVPRYCARIGRQWDPFRRDVLSAADLGDCLARQAVTLQPGDILLLRYGWIAAFLNEPDPARRNRIFKEELFAGLSGHMETWEFLWDHRIAAVAGDNPTCEASPMEKGKNLHLAIARLGLTIGEFFALDALAEDCARDGQYVFLLTSSPLNLRGGVGSPANAIAVK